MLARRSGFVILYARFGHGIELARLQRLAVDLAGGQPGNIGHQLEAGRDHVGGQVRAQRGAQGVRVQPRLALGLEESHQLLDSRQIAQDYRRGAHAGQAIQGSLDFPELDAESTHLHLIVAAAQAMDLPMLINAGQVSAAIHAGVVIPRRPRIGQELLGSQFGPAQITASHTGTGDAQLSDLPLRQHRAVFAAHQHAVVGQRRAYGHRLAGQQFGQARGHRRFCGTVGVEQAPAGRGPARHQEIRTDFAAQVHDAQPGHIMRKQRKQGWHRVQHGDSFAHQGVRQAFRIRGQHLGRDPQRRADQIADPDLFERHVEGHRKALVDLVFLAHAQHFVLAAQEMANAGVADGHALGLAGGAGGIDDIGGMLGQQPFAPAQHTFHVFRQRPGRPGLHAVQPDLRARDEAARACVLQAGQHAVWWSVGFERQPRRPSLGDGRLHHEQVGSARQAQAHNMPGPHTGRDQVMRGQVGAVSEHVISEGVIQPMNGDGGGTPADRGFQNIGQRLCTQQVRPIEALENHRNGKDPAMGFLRIDPCRKISFKQD